MIREDWNQQIGLGHLARGVALAQMLKGYFDNFFYVKRSNNFQINAVIESIFNLIIVEREFIFFDSLTDCEFVVLNGYHFATIYQHKIKEKGCLLVCVDDLHVKHFIAHAIINHAPGILKEKYSAESYTSFLLAPEYALLRPVFLQLKHLLKGYRQSNEKNLDSVFPIVEFSYPIWRELQLVNGHPMMVWPEYIKSRSQDHDAGQWYWYNCKRKLSSLYANNSGSIILEENEVQDIDTPSDWTIAELKYKSMHVD